MWRDSWSITLQGPRFLSHQISSSLSRCFLVFSNNSQFGWRSLLAPKRSRCTGGLAAIHSHLRTSLQGDVVEGASPQNQLCSVEVASSKRGLDGGKSIGCIKPIITLGCENHGFVMFVYVSCRFSFAQYVEWPAQHTVLLHSRGGTQYVPPWEGQCLTQSHPTWNNLMLVLVPCATNPNKNIDFF